MNASIRVEDGLSFSWNTRASDLFEAWRYIFTEDIVQNKNKMHIFLFEVLVSQCQWEKVYWKIANPLIVSQ